MLSVQNLLGFEVKRTVMELGNGTSRKTVKSRGVKRVQRDRDKERKKESENYNEQKAEEHFYRYRLLCPRHSRDRMRATASCGYSHSVRTRSAPARGCHRPDPDWAAGTLSRRTR
jgi:hypothetical protein